MTEISEMLILRSLTLPHVLAQVNARDDRCSPTRRCLQLQLTTDLVAAHTTTAAAFKDRVDGWFLEDCMAERVLNLEENVCGVHAPPN
jgi:hypothetical protein